MMDRLQAARALAREHKDRGDDCGRLARVVLDVLPESAAPELPHYAAGKRKLLSQYTGPMSIITRDDGAKAYVAFGTPDAVVAAWLDGQGGKGVLCNQVQNIADEGFPWLRP